MADEFAVATVTRESAPDPDAEQFPSGEGYVPRIISANVDSVIWQRNGAPNPPDTVKLSVDGWWLHDGRLAPFVSGDAIRIGVSDRILIALVKTPDGSWSQLSAETTIPLGGGGTKVADNPRGGPRVLHGSSIAAVSQLLADTAPSTVARLVRALDADARGKAIWDEQLAGGK